MTPLQDFDIDYVPRDSAPAAPAPTVVTVEAPAVVETVEVTRLQSMPKASDLMVAGEAWDWTNLRDYVVRKIEETHGPFPRNFLKESGIFKGFISRYGDRAAAIARCAFEVHGGMWRGAPIAVSRFTKGSDPFFAEVILRSL